MKDNLLDLISHTNSLEGIDLVKVIGTDTETKITGIAEDKSIILFGQFKTPIADFIGTFGMPSLGKLKTILSIEEYKENAVINVAHGTKEDPEVPVALNFENKNKDFRNSFRFMAKNVVEDRIKNVAFSGTKWDVEFAPTNVNIQRLKWQAAANSEETTFTVKTNGKDLMVFFGDPSGHAGDFVFQSDVSGNMNRAWRWPVKVFLSIMDLYGDKTVRFSDAGVAEVIVDSGISVYSYYIPAQTK